MRADAKDLIELLKAEAARGVLVNLVKESIELLPWSLKAHLLDGRAELPHSLIAHGA